MKKLIIAFCFGAALMALPAFRGQVYDVKPATAEVTTLEGLFVFTDCKPVKEYKYLGTVSSNVQGFGGTQYESVRSRLISKAKKEYPNAEGIILQLAKGQDDKADVITFLK